MFFDMEKRKIIDLDDDLRRQDQNKLKRNQYYSWILFCFLLLFVILQIVIHDHDCIASVEKTCHNQIHTNAYNLQYNFLDKKNLLFFVNL